MIFTLFNTGFSFKFGFHEHRRPFIGLYFAEYQIKHPQSAFASPDKQPKILVDLTAHKFMTLFAHRISIFKYFIIMTLRFLGIYLRQPEKSINLCERAQNEFDSLNKHEFMNSKYF